MKRRIPQPALIGLIVLGLVVVGLGGWFMIVRPQNAKAKDLDAQITDTNNAISAARALTLEAKKGAQIRVADLFRLTKAMPDETDMPGILLELNQVAEDSGITFDQITPATTATPIAGYLAIPITVEFTGNFYDLSDFLYRLRNLVDVRRGALDATGRLFAIDSIEFAEAPPPPGFPQISANLTDRRVRLRHRHGRRRFPDPRPARQARPELPAATARQGRRPPRRHPALRPLPRRGPRKPWRRRSIPRPRPRSKRSTQQSAASCCSACSRSRCRAR